MAEEMSIEGDPEESDEDLRASTVLWEKSIQQSIFVDLSEDESLHLSDLEGSLALQVSRAESAGSEVSVHLSGSAELSDLDETSSGSSNVSSQSVKAENKTKSSISHVSPQRPNTMQDDPPLSLGYDDRGQNTSDEEQEELPYDGDLGSPYFNQACGSEGNSSPDGVHTVNGSPEGAGLLELDSRDDIEEHSVEESASTSEGDTEHEDPKPSDVAAPRGHPGDITQLFLKHFSQEELLMSGKMITAETLPEVSLLESMDDTVLSLAPTHNNTFIPGRNHSENFSVSNSGGFSGRTSEKTNSSSKNAFCVLHNEAGSESNVPSTLHSVSSDKDSEQSSTRDSIIDALQETGEEEDQNQLIPPLVRTRSFSEMKYGQGQVHYPLPDFSKVAPKVKIPKAPSVPARPAPQRVSTMHRTQSSPGMLELISRVLEDSVQSPEKPFVFNDEERQAPGGLVHHLQAEYDKLLTKYAEAENLIDQMRLGANTQPPSDLKLYSECDDDDEEDNGRNLAEGSHLGPLAPHLPPSVLSETMDQKGETTAQSKVRPEASSRLHQPEEGPTEGDRMTAELRDIMNTFMQKVEEFRASVGNMSMSTTEQQMMLRSMMEAQDQLERQYRTKKEEHRALEMQNYMGLNRNTGTFDSNRLVEGDIFRIGMHLDDIKEMIDKNMCEQISPPHSSSAPTPAKEEVHVMSGPVHLLTHSPQSSLHQGPCAGFSTLVCKVETQEVEFSAEEMEEVSEECGGGGGQEQSNELKSPHCARNTDANGYQSGFWTTRASLDKLDIGIPEDERGNEDDSGAVSSVGRVHCGTLAHGRDQTKEWTHESAITVDTDVLPEADDVGDVGDCVSLAVEPSSSSDALKLSDPHSLSQPPQDNVHASQRIVTSETDSGFGSSYLNQSGSGLFQPNLITESVQSHHDDLSSSERASSCSNLQTTIHSASLTTQLWVSSHPAVQTQSSAAVELWVESTTKEPSLKLHGSECSRSAPQELYVSEPMLSTTMDSEEKGRKAFSCSCNNSEAIQALQSEVLRLKKDLEQGLVQLPELTQKMDYLTSKYRQDRQERRSKTRSRNHSRPARQSPSRVEDWISSDMEPSNSRGTDSGVTAASEVLLQFHNSLAGSRRGSRVNSGRRSPQSSKGAEGNDILKSSGLSYSSFSEGKGRDFERVTPLTPQTIVDSFKSKCSWSPLSSPSLHKPLLQVSYCSSSSLPASYKLRELPPHYSTSHHRKRSTQSDTALLPSNVFFQRTPSPACVTSKSVAKTGRRRGSKEEDMSRTLDEAIEVARCMKRATDRMAQRLSADLAKAQSHRKLRSKCPHGGDKLHTL